MAESGVETIESEAPAEGSQNKHWESEDGNSVALIKKEANLLERLKEKRISRRTLMAAATATAGISSVVGAFLGRVDAGSSQKTEDAYRGFEPTSDAHTQTIDTVATPSADYTKVPGTNVEVPTITPGRVETPTPLPTTELGRTVEPTETPNVRQETWQVKVDPTLSTRSSFRSTEDDVAIINKTLGTLPKLGRLELTLVAGQDSRIELPQNPNMPAKITIGRDVFQLEPKILDEMASFYDVEMNPQLEKLLPEEDFVKLKELREQIVAKYRNFPSIAQMFAKRGSDSPQAVIAKYPDAVFIAQDNQNYPLPENIFARQLTTPLLAQFAQETGSQLSGYLDWAAFRRGEAKKLEALAQANPYYKLAFEILDENSSSLANWQQFQGEQSLAFSPKELYKWYKSEGGQEAALVNYVNLALTQAFGESDPRLGGLMSPADLANKKRAYDMLFTSASNEIFGRALSRWHMGLVGDNLIRDYQEVIGRAKAGAN